MIRAAGPDLLLAAARLGIFVGLLNGVAAARGLAVYAQWWPVGELLALLVAPFILWIFAREDRTPIYQRVIALPLGIVVLGGVAAFVRFLSVFWLYLLAKSLPLFRRRPTVRERNDGLVRSLLGVPAFLLLATIFLNRPSEPVLGLMAAARFDAQTRYLGNLMLFGVVYFVLAGVIMGAWARLWGDDDRPHEESTP